MQFYNNIPTYKLCLIYAIFEKRQEKNNYLLTRVNVLLASRALWLWSGRLWATV